MKKIESGFSLIEILVVLSIVAIIVMIAVPKFTHFTQQKNQKTEVQKVLDHFNEAANKAITLKKTVVMHLKEGQDLKNDKTHSQLYLQSKEFIFHQIAKVEFDLTGRVKYKPSLQCVDVSHKEFPELKIKLLVNPMGEYQFINDNQTCVA